MASRSVNKVILVGHLGRDAETKFTPGGAAVTRFSVATSRRWKDKDSGEWKEETDWSNVTLWRSENLANYLTKGKQVYVEGRLHTRSYEDKDGKKVYFAGDTCVFGDMQLIGRIYQPDLAALPIGGHFTMDPREAAVALELLGTKRCLPCHWGTFPLLAGTPDELKKLSPDVEILTPEPGEAVEL